MIAIPSKDFAFIHVPKTAGTSIREKLKDLEPTTVVDGFVRIREQMVDVGGGNGRGPNVSWYINNRPYIRHGLHMGREELETLVPEFDCANTFAVVRNPYDRLVSAFFHDLRDRIRPGYLRLESAQEYNFEIWLKKSREENSVMTRNLTHWVDTDKDTIIKFENLNNELYKMEDVLGYKLGLEHKNKGFAPHLLLNHHNDVIRPDVKKYIREEFAEEIELFGYGDML